MAKGIRIVVGNSKSRLIGSRKKILQLHKEFRIRAKGYFWSPAYRSRAWDGFVKYISAETGSFSTGLLDQVIALLDKHKYRYEITDDREAFSPVREVRELGGKILRKDQLEAVDAFMDNEVGGIIFRRGMMAEATNTGKSLIAGAIVGSFSSKRTALFLTDSKDLFKQAYNDFQKFFPGEVGQVASGYPEVWKRINIVMVQTFGIRLSKSMMYKNWLARCDIVIVDEGDKVIGRKDCRKILGYSYNAPIRICLSGSILKHKGTAKDKAKVHKGSTKNQEQLQFFGPIIHMRTNKENVESGISTRPDIRISTGNETIKAKGDWEYEYDKGIVRNRDRHKKVWQRVMVHIKKKRLPIIILYKLHKHGRRLFKQMPEEISEKYNVELIHSKTSNRFTSIKHFNQGKVDILISSMIIQRGLNLPLMKVLINAAAGDSEVAVVQIFGRLLRKHKSKKKVWMEDFWDTGHYLQRHSKHRLSYYKNQDFPVKELYKS